MPISEAHQEKITAALSGNDADYLDDLQHRQYDPTIHGTNLEFIQFTMNQIAAHINDAAYLEAISYELMVELTKSLQRAKNFLPQNEFQQCVLLIAKMREAQNLGAIRSILTLTLSKLIGVDLEQLLDSLNVIVESNPSGAALATRALLKLNIQASKEEAIADLEQAYDEFGSSEASYQLGQLKLQEKQTEIAIPYFLHASESHHTGALLTLYQLCASNKTLAAEHNINPKNCLTQSANLGNPIALFTLGQIKIKDSPEEAFRYFNLASSLNYTPAYFNLGIMLLQPTPITKEQCLKGAKIIHQAAVGGDPRAAMMAQLFSAQTNPTSTNDTAATNAIALLKKQEDRIEALEQQLSKLQRENATLKKQLDENAYYSADEDTETTQDTTPTLWN